MSEGGHDVPRQKIIERYHETLGILPRLIQFADTVILYDNSHEVLNSFLIKEDNQIKIIGTVPNWATEIIKNNPD